MYIRFQTPEGNGLFTEAGDSVFGDFPRPRRDIRRRDRREFDEFYDWLVACTPIPPREAYTDTFARFPRTWFMQTAAQHVAAAWRVCILLNRYGSRIAPVVSTRPGLILFEDDIQIVVRPNRTHTPRPAPKPRTTPRWNGDRTTIRRWPRTAR